MYSPPRLVRHGSFRELTQAGWAYADDQLFFKSIAGCNLGDCPTDQGPGTNEVGGSR
jgi:hypothetical protein